MALEKYNEKRDFNKTKEPKGVKKSSKDKLRFVVQKHAASRLHYDFRLEIDGVLVSWAVPKGPSSNPSDKRLAVQTEDHPMDYIDFEGTIPKGEYGGGTVMVWDIGTYHAEGSTTLAEDKRVLRKQLKEGSIKVTLEGKKLKGSWHIVRMKGENRQWLLMKAKDDYANQKEFEGNSVLSGLDFKGIEKTDAVWGETKRPGDDKTVSKRTSSKNKSTAKEDTSTVGFTASDLEDAVKLTKFPYDWRPQLATLADEAFDNEEWLFETKFDGYRALAQIKENDVQLISRNGISFNAKYPAIVEALKTINKDMILDGEVVAEDAKGKSNFQWLQHLEDFPDKGKLKFYVFDILYFAGFDLRQLELLDRKKILKALLPKHKSIIYSDHVIGNGIKAFEDIKKKNGEGIIAKKATSKYHDGKRTKDWLKIKTDQQQEMVIGGFTDPKGSRKGLGALLCGYYKNGDFHYSGKVGTGFTEAILDDLRKKLAKIERKTAPFIKPPKMSGIYWVKPELVAQIKFSEFTETGSMRHPVYLGLRDDKKASEVTIEEPKIEAETIANKSKSGSKPSKKSTTKKGSDKVEFTNLDKLFWPDLKITKGDVINYYDAVADYIMPYLKDRPQSLRRTPDGIKSEGFFQKDVAGKVPKWIKTRKIKSDSKEESIEYLLCQDKDTLLFMANWGCIELNPWSSRVGSLNNPDYIIFDIDPKDAPMKNVIATALKVKEILDQLKVPAYIKTSGGNGLHVFIPVKPKYTYNQTRNFSHLVSQMVHRDLPKITSLERMPAKRKGKVYLDFLQNGKGKTMASIYSLRPREGATISVPLDWDEVNNKLDLKKFNLKTITKRLEEKGDLWKDFFSDAVDLKEVLKGMG
ncbi:bifunctional non-homologous end joining protein LigD [Flavobacterium arsenatis]|uniref:DNA ligase (ATP) n=1 Tax=Flavobacterium arsenatis TaxID=1484332 RepID=A0ABU1TQV3_9FLAO|nr:DNA ligase D [Flavobacterium arsenatis]MDR6968359.1 bifunctional non-homologous end joining protein LigD [Flavobacterium arsenatis]